VKFFWLCKVVGFNTGSDLCGMHVSDFTNMYVRHVRFDGADRHGWDWRIRFDLLNKIK
jgi:hypothetical protein